MKLQAVVAVVAFGVGFISHKASQQYKAQGLTASSSHNFWERRVDQFAALGRNEPIVMLGDSRTDEGAWPEWLGRPVSFRGISGETLPETIRRITPSIPSHAKVVFVQIGINDIQRGRTTAQIIRDYKVLLQKVKPRSEHVVVCAVTQVGSSSKNHSEHVSALNSKLRELAQKEETGWLDINPRVCANGLVKPEYTADGIHPTGALYREWARAIKGELKRLNV